ncbi:Zn finger protein [Sulfolobales Beppu rod-shaped virus 1]|uniref:Zn finger protein n=1 Tax=Sulfolobales Beppu rod-shaped virus 1 TaxID=2493121 RepID=A0A3S8NF51_9VIRU|nr:Zn finger protein [Sulfolobales Beppu rod-shaped virus 1]AZI75896.1 Zn finger protein [Sulfolobales Beppu rod-shaped virus 1]
MQYYKCPFCERHFKSFFMLKGHVREMHYNISNCPICGYKCNNMTGLLIHLAKAKNNQHLAYWYIFRDSHTRRENKLKILQRHNANEKDLKNYFKVEVS